MNEDQVIYERITKVVAGEESNNHIYYTYDVDGTIIGFNYKNNEYFYIPNIQGDIVKSLDINGDVMVSYTYDAWGNNLDQTDNDLAKISCSCFSTCRSNTSYDFSHNIRGQASIKQAVSNNEGIYTYSKYSLNNAEFAATALVLCGGVYAFGALGGSGAT